MMLTTRFDDRPALDGWMLFSMLSGTRTTAGDAVRFGLADPAPMMAPEDDDDFDDDFDEDDFEEDDLDDLDEEEEDGEGFEDLDDIDEDFEDIDVDDDY